MSHPVGKTQSQQYVSFTLITFFGSALSSIGTFLAIGRDFESIGWLAWALSLKTLAGVVFAKPITRLTQTYGTKTVLVFSQLIGLPILALLYGAFALSNPIIILAAVFVSGVPGLIVNILLSPVLRQLSDSSASFKKIQGKFQLLSGAGMLVAGLIAPPLLDKVQIGGLYSLDAFTYIIGALYLYYYIDFKTITALEGPPTGAAPKVPRPASNEDWHFLRARLLLVTIPSLFLIGLIPIAASSASSLGFTFSPRWVEWLWTMECLAGILAGTVYTQYAFMRTSRLIHYLPMLCSLPLILAANTKSIVLFFLAFLLFGTLFTYGINRYRDDFIEESDGYNLRITHSAFYQQVLSFLRTISPLLIWVIAELAQKIGISAKANAFVLAQLSLVGLAVVGIYFIQKRSRQWVKTVFANITLFVSGLSVLLMGVVVMYQLEHYQRRQYHNWLEELPRSLVYHLVESDYIPLNNEVNFIKKTGLFKRLSIEDKDGAYITGFGQTSSPCESIVPVVDDAGTKWGSICAEPESGGYLAILTMPFVAIAIVMSGLSFWLSKILRMNAKKELEAVELQAKQASVIKKVSAQMAHDIKSPLAAFEMILGMKRDEITEAEMLILRRAVGRIRDLANNLVQQHSIKGTEVDDLPPHETKSKELVLPLIESIVSETRIRLRGKHQVQVETKYDRIGAGVFCELDPTQFKRVISNLINNAVEACENGGHVTITIRVTDAKCIIEVQDNGKGIPAHVLPALGKSRITYGKDNYSGSGIGVLHAVEQLTKWEGQLKFTQLARGTMVIITLPITPAPSWFAGGISFRQDETTIICDDDESVIAIWEERIKERSGTIKFAASGNELRRIYQGLVLNERDCLFLIDYELGASSESGLSLVEELGLNDVTHGRRAILVTSHYDETEIRSKCQAYGMTILPKFLIAFTPIEVE